MGTGRLGGESFRRPKLLGASILWFDLQPEPNPRGFEKNLHLTTVDHIHQQGVGAEFYQVDISKLSDLETVFESGISAFKRLDIVVSCAGFWASSRKFADEDDELWIKIMNVNILGTSKPTRLALKQFLKQEIDEDWGSRGRIINISSSAGVVAFPGQVAYSTSKAAIKHMSRAGALDHAKDLININCIAPGVVATAMARDNFEDEAIIQHMRKATPWDKLGTVDDIAGTALFLCSKQASWITGQTFSVDGGMKLGVPP